MDLAIGYRTWFQGHRDPLDMPTGAGAAAAFESLQPGAGAALDEYLELAESSYKLALEHFLYDDFSSAGHLPESPACCDCCPGWHRC